MPLFTVIIPAYNRADLLGTTLQSVLVQTFTDYEIIVVDDGSSEDLSSVVREFGNRVRFLRQANSGPGRARNFGASAARGEYLAMLDSDDVWYPWTLEVYAEAIRVHGQPSFLADRLKNFTEEQEIRLETRGPCQAESYVDYLATSPRGLYCGAGQLVVRTELFLRAGGFTEQKINAEDHDLVLRLGTEPGFVSIREPAMVGYRQHSGAVTQNLQKTLDGMQYLLDQERNGKYPGGRERQAERRRILTQHLRPVTFAALRQGNRQTAWKLFRQTFAWQLQQGRVRYLAAFLAHAGAACFRRGA